MNSLKFFVLSLVMVTALGQGIKLSQNNATHVIKKHLTTDLTACLPATDKVDKDAYNKCLLGEMKKIQSKLAAGVPELGIPSMDPLFIEKIEMIRSEPPVTIDAAFTNLRITGIKDMDIKFLNIDIFGEPKQMKMGLVVPTMLMRGQYKIGGNVFLLPIEGSGNFISKLNTVVVEGSANIIPSGKGIKTTTENVQVGFKIKDMATKMDNLFEGNQVLSDTMHHFMNENAQMLLDELRPTLSGTLNEMIAGLFTAIFDAAPVDLHKHAVTNSTTRRKRHASLRFPINV